VRSRSSRSDGGSRPPCRSGGSETAGGAIARRLIRTSPALPRFVATRLIDSV
jgi:hypothetical protein